jgi:hypothetical protein
MTIKGEDAGDYFRVLCEQCGSPTNNEYLGWDPSVPHFRATCPNCKKTGEWKLDCWTGLSTKRARKSRQGKVITFGSYSLGRRGK